MSRSPSNGVAWATGARCPVALLMAVLFCWTSATCAAGPSRNEVLVYCANETAPDAAEARNYDTILGWLRTGSHPKHAHLARCLDRDRRVFQAAVDVEVNDLCRAILQRKDGPQAAIFTNRLARQGKCLLWKHGWDDFREASFSLPAHPNPILTSNTLSRPETIRRMLEFVASEFDPRRYELILITKSHGSASRAITPRLAVRAEETTREELLRVAAGQVASDELPDWAGRLGISKAEYFAILGEAGSQGIHFALVYQEACNAFTEEIRKTPLPDNVDRLMLLRTDADYINLLYADIFRRMGEGDRLADVLTRDLPSKFVVLRQHGTVVSGASTFTFPLWASFVPVGLWGLWVVWSRVPDCKRHTALKPGKLK